MRFGRTLTPWADLDHDLTSRVPASVNIISTRYFHYKYFHHLPCSPPISSPAWGMGVFCCSLTRETRAEVEAEADVLVANISSSSSASDQDPHQTEHPSDPGLSGQTSAQRSPDLRKVCASSATKIGPLVRGTRIHTALQYPRNFKTKIRFFFQGRCQLLKNKF